MKIDKYTAILGNVGAGCLDLGGLTKERPLATLPFDGKYRLIDFQLSSIANSGIRSVYAIFSGKNVRSVFDHVRSGRVWGLNTLLSHYFPSFLEDQEDCRMADRDYYSQLLTYLKTSGSDQTIYMPFDILCNINLEQVIHVHNASGGKVTVVYKRLPKTQISEMNEILQIDDTDTVAGKISLSDAPEIAPMNADIYVVDTPWLIEKLEEEAKKEQMRKICFVLRDLLAEAGALAFEHSGYLANINSVQAYYQANMDMLDPQKFYALFYGNQKIYTKVKNEEATYFDADSRIKNSQFASGSIIRGAVEHSVVGRNCLVDESASVRWSVVSPKVQIHKMATVEYAIIDKNVQIPEGVTLRGSADNLLVIGKGQEITGDIIQ